MKKRFNLEERLKKMDLLSKVHQGSVWGGLDGVSVVQTTPTPTYTPTFSFTSPPTQPPVTFGIKPPGVTITIKF